MGLTDSRCRTVVIEGLGLLGSRNLCLTHKHALLSMLTYSVQLCWVWLCKGNMILEEEGRSQGICIP